MIANVIVAGKNMLSNEALKLALSRKGYKVFIEKKELSTLDTQIKNHNIHAVIWDEAISEEKHETIIELNQTILRGLKSIFIVSSRTLFLMGLGLTNGINGFVHQEGGIDELDNCIKNVLKEHLYISPQLAGSKKPRLIHREEKRRVKPTPREERILKFVKDKKTNKEIARILNISRRTVENHRYNLCKKLGLEGHNSLYQYARHNY